MAAEDDFKRRLGERVRAVRRQSGLSQLDMVRYHGISLSHFQKIERGSLDPRVSTLCRLAEAFGMTLSDLLAGV
jgi:transcriptional regulator with XRE-family HTH domain